MFRGTSEQHEAELKASKRARDQAISECQKAVATQHKSQNYATRKVIDQASQTQQKISAELTATQAAVGQASRQAAAWAALIDSTDKALRNLGDCQTYFEVVEAELRELAGCLEQKSAQQPQQQEATTAAAGARHEPAGAPASEPPVALPVSSQDPAKT